MTGLVWAQPVADVFSLLRACLLYMRISKKMMANKELLHKKKTGKIALLYRLKGRGSEA